MNGLILVDTAVGQLNMGPIMPPEDGVRNGWERN
jgi:hypothetical protein